METKTQEALKMAIEDAMKFVNTLNGYEDANQSKPFKTEADKYLSYASVVIKSLATSLKEALAQPAQEPVAYEPTSQEQSVMHQAMIRSSKLVHKAHPAPSWQGLSDDEIDIIDEANWDEDHKFWGIHDFARAIEQELKRKNHFNGEKNDS